MAYLIECCIKGLYYLMGIDLCNYYLQFLRDRWDKKHKLDSK